MFIYDLTEKQKSTFLILAKQLSLSDSKLTPEEERELELMERETGMQIPAAAESFDKSTLLGVFDSSKSKIATILELILLGFADGEFSEEENQYIHELASAFRITDDDLNRYARWALKQHEVLQEGKEFWGEKTSAAVYARP